jgi:exonuclease III
MRVATWNCHTSLGSKWGAVEALDADVITVQECGPGTAAEIADRGGWTCEWEKGRHPRSGGVAVLARSPYRIEARERSEPCLVSAMIGGPRRFRFVGFWAMTRSSDDDVYSLQAARLIEQLPADDVPTVVAGDFNASSANAQHRRNVASLEALGLVSAYHFFHGVEHAGWKHPTSYHHWQELNRHHMDYVFVPEAWTIHSVEVGTFEDYSRPGGLSDHVPVVVELS